MKRADNMSMYERIYDLVRKVPPGRVVAYGHIARIAGGCSPRNVGYAMSALPFSTDVPWQRVINVKGEISLRKNSDGDLIQRQLLEAEGITFDKRGIIDLDRYGWSGPEDWDF